MRWVDTWDPTMWIDYLNSEERARPFNPFRKLNNPYNNRESNDYGGWSHSDQELIETEFSWAIFTMYWPALAMCALVGRE
jgi:hypothetical protein